MGTTLTRALGNVNERQRGRESGKTPPTITDEIATDTTVLPSQKDEGLRGVCRALFHHCVAAIGHVSPGEHRENAVSRGVLGVR